MPSDPQPAQPRSDVSLLRALLVEGLKVGPRPGAALRNFLDTEFSLRAQKRFREAFPRRFADVLRDQGDLVRITRPESGIGDVTVCLLGESGAKPSLKPQVRREAWSAFTNPDPARRRWVNRQSGDVRHFVSGDGELALGSDWIEVYPIQGQVQARWMQEFVASLDSDYYRAPVLKQIAGTEPYSAAVNTAFLNTLDLASQQQWRIRRGELVSRHLLDWARENKVPEQLLFDGAAPGAIQPYGAPSITVPGAPSAVDEGSLARERSSRSREAIIQWLTAMEESEFNEIRIDAPASLLAKIGNRAQR